MTSTQKITNKRQNVKFQTLPFCDDVRRQRLMDKRAESFAKKWAGLAIRVRSVVKFDEISEDGSKAADGIRKDAPLRIKEELYTAIYNKMLERLHNPDLQKATVLEINQTVRDLVTGTDVGAVSDEALQMAPENVFSRSMLTQFLVLRTHPEHHERYGSNSNIKGWNRDELKWVLGSDPSSIFKSFKSIREGEHGQYWKDRLDKCTLQSYKKESHRYSQDIFLLYFNFKQYLYLSTLKEAVAITGKGKDKSDFNAYETCPKRNLATFKQTVDYFNRSMRKNNLPTVNCWNDVFSRRLP
jgi:hypothetical protein